MSDRFTRAYVLAAGVLCFGFLADTVSTLAAGPEILAYDLNPLSRRLHFEGYVAWSGIRLAVGLVLLTACWPDSLVMRDGLCRRRKWIAGLLPFCYRDAKTYAVSYAVTAIGPLKAISAVANFRVVWLGTSGLPTAATIGLGTIAGILAGNVILLWHHARRCPSTDTA